MLFRVRFTGRKAAVCQQGEKIFKADALLLRNAQPDGGADAGAHKGSCLFHRFPERHAVYRVRRDDGGEDIPGAVPGMARGMGPVDLRGQPVRPLGDEVDVILIFPKPRDHHLIRPHGVKLSGEQAELVPLPAAFPVGGVRQQAGLRDVRRDDGRAGQEEFQSFAVLRRDRPIGLSVISHHRVQDEGHVRPAGEKFLHDPDLFGASQKAAVNPVKPKAQLLPFRQIIPQVRRTVVHEMDRKSGVVGKKGGGYRTDLYLHGADDGNRLGGGAASVAGDVVDHGYFFRNPAGHIRSLLYTI